MADARLLAAIRRFWNEEQITAAYQRIFEAYSSRLDAVTVIVGKSSESESAQAQVVIQREDYLQWMEALEERLAELQDAADSIPPGSATEHTNFGARYTRT